MVYDAIDNVHLNGEIEKKKQIENQVINNSTQSQEVDTSESCKHR